MHGASDRVMLGKVCVRNRFQRRKTLRFIGRDRFWKPGSTAAPSLDLVSEGEDSVLFFVLPAMDRKSFNRLPTPDRTFAPVQIGGNLLPRFQSFLRSIPLWHHRTPAKLYQRLRRLAALRCVPVKCLL